MPSLLACAVTIVLELFTSEGCSSCPPADRFLQKLIESQPAADVQIVALGEHVDYWDRLGWKDRFSSAHLTARQQTYGTRFNLESVYTPQIVVDGRTELVGTDASAARRAIDAARARPHGVVKIAINPASQALRVTVTASELPPLSRGDHADIVLAITEDHLTSEVKRGENQGRVLTHAAVVRHLAAIGEADAAAPSTVQTTIPLGPDWVIGELKVIAFVQERRGRAILASAVEPLGRR